MTTEKINRIEILDSGELFVGIEGDGDPSYQYVYREAAGVYWDSSRKGFKSTELKNWTAPQWFAHILDIVLYVGVELEMGEKITWKDVSEADKTLMLSGEVQNSTTI